MRYCYVLYRNRFRTVAWILACIVLFTSSFFHSATVTAQDDELSIKLRAGTIIPGEESVQSATTQALTISEYAPGEEGYYIVQFRGPVEQVWKDSVIEHGAELLDYLPDYAYKVRMTSEEAGQIEQIDTVHWVGVFQPAYKLNPALDYSEPNLYAIRVETGIDADLVADEIEALGIDVIERGRSTLTVAADADQITPLAQVRDVAWIDAYLLKQKHNEYGAGVILGANAANANGYDGSTQTVAVADTGLGGGTAATAHTDIPASRVTAIYDWPGSAVGCFQTLIEDGSIDVDSGHGTHVSTSVLGGGGPAGEGKGTAPAANLIFQSTESWVTIKRSCQILGGWPPNGYFLTGLPNDLGDLYQQAYVAGARIHSNSWGANLDGDYTADSANTDAFIWNNPDMTITFSAGNDGVDNNDDGLVDDDSTGSPATAKNVITVGASENDRAGDYSCDTGLAYTSSDTYQADETCTSMGGNNILGTAGQRWGFTTEPLFSDLTAGNSEQIAPFSSRGPTDDGRIKPDVVAPGTWILSGYSNLYQEAYDASANPQNGLYQYDGWGMPVNDKYKYMGGTSMSNPIVAGAAAVVRDFYNKSASHEASAALVKATLINTAVDLLDENNDGVNDNDYPIPNTHEGWGRVNLASATDGSQEYIDATTGLATGNTDTYQFTVQTGGSPFKVSLVWSDFPSTETAAQNLVNNLDLVVTSPAGAVVYRSIAAPDAGAVYLGNVFSGGWSQSGGSADSVNNVENVFVPSATSGTWTVEVTGENVPNGPQPYALVTDGSFDVALAVTVGWILAEPADGVVDFRWQTLTEIGTAGFHILAQGTNGKTRITEELITSKVIDSVVPTDYSFSAETDASIFYLQEMGIDGSLAEHGPFEMGAAYGAHVESDEVQLKPVLWLPMLTSE